MSELENLLKLVRRTPGKIEAMSDEDRRAYNAKAAREARARRKETRQTGEGKPTLAITRDLLADIAIAMLATDAVGSDTIQKALHRHFEGRAGFPLQIKSDCKRGKLKPKVLKV